MARLVNEHALKQEPKRPSSASEPTATVSLSSLDIRTSAEGSANALLYHIYPDGSRGGTGAHGASRPFSSNIQRQAAGIGVGGSNGNATGVEDSASSMMNGGSGATMSRAVALVLKDADAALASADKAVRIWERRSGVLIH